ncbi:MAG: hypothetical protein M1820_000383 [Bogoriella megaspora]|nr:MAG: hypothetical protein M1820_000383 [Bogoriella megaspora]
MTNSPSRPSEKPLRSALKAAEYRISLMEPFSFTASVLGTTDIALRTSSALAKYVKNTHNASRERSLLAEEAHSLSKLLERIRDRANSVRDEQWLADHADIVKQFESAFQELASALKIDPTSGQPLPESRLKHLRSTAKWSFNRSEVYLLLQRVDRIRGYASSLLSDDQQLLVERLDQKYHETEEQRRRRQILDWLCPIQMSQIHQSISDRAGKGSGQWFLSSDSFGDWKTGLNNPLWCWGIPGAGKTVIASIIVNNLRQATSDSQKGKVGIAVVYLKYNDHDQTPENLFGSVLQQLVQDSDFIPPQVISSFERHHGRNTTATFDEIVQMLQSTIEGFQETFFVIDGLDECVEEFRWELVEQLTKFLPKLRLLITSRFLDAIDEELVDFVRFEIRADPADIELYIEYQIKKNRNLRRIIQRAPKLRADIKEGVVKTADSMFLLARLHVESLASAAGLSVKHVRQKLQTLPTTLTGSYDNAMQRILDQELGYKQVALQHALAIEPGNTDLDEELIVDGQSITSLCAGLVMVDQRTGSVNLVHYSTKNYFETTRSNYFGNFHANIAQSCATYLTLQALQNIPISNIAQQYPLACYSAQYLGDHARNAPEEALEASILDSICQLLADPSKRRALLSLLDSLDFIRSGYFSAMSISGDCDDEEEAEHLDFPIPGSEDLSSDLDTSGRSYSLSVKLDKSSIEASSEVTNSLLSGEEAEGWEANVRSGRIPEVTALHLAASMGLAKVASMLLKETPNIDTTGETGKTALALAMERGFERAVDFLLGSGACVDLRHDHGRSGLLLIAERGWRKAGDAIIAKARDELSSKSNDTLSHQVQLILATYSGQGDSIGDIVMKGALDLTGGDADVASICLFLAVENGDEGTVEALLDCGVDLNSRDSRGQTSLFRATRRRDMPMMHLLLRRGADVDQSDDEGRTAWSANVRLLDRGVLDILLHAGADPSTRGLQGVSELYTAAKDGDAGLVRFMLNCGTDPSLQTIYEWAPLHWAAAYGHSECVTLLIEAGANVSVCSDQGVTPLDLAKQSGQSSIVEMLISKNAKEAGKESETVSTAALREPVSIESKWATVSHLSDASGKLDELPLASKLLLVFDKPLSRTLVKGTSFGQFVYPWYYKGSTTPEGYIYQTSHLADSSTSTMKIRRAVRRAEMGKYPLGPEDFNDDDVLFEIQRLRLDYQEFQLRGGVQNRLPNDFRMHKDWTGSWRVNQINKDENEFQFRTTPDWSGQADLDSQWITNDGILLARSGWDDKTPNICIELTLQRPTIDLIVSCWTVKLWAESALAMKQET